MRIADALEVLAKRPASPEGAASAAAMAELESRVAGHVIALRDAVTALEKRSPPDAEIVRRLSAVEFESAGNARSINSLRAQLGAKKREQRSPAPPFVLGSIHGLDVPQYPAGTPVLGEDSGASEEDA